MCTVWRSLLTKKYEDMLTKLPEVSERDVCNAIQAWNLLNIWFRVVQGHLTVDQAKQMENDELYSIKKRKQEKQEREDFLAALEPIKLPCFTCPYKYNYQNQVISLRNQLRKFLIEMEHDMGRNLRLLTLDELEVRQQALILQDLIHLYKDNIRVSDHEKRRVEDRISAVIQTEKERRQNVRRQEALTKIKNLVQSFDCAPGV